MSATGCLVFLLPKINNNLGASLMNPGKNFMSVGNKAWTIFLKFRSEETLYEF